jgi:hypothetical protein
MSNEQLGIDIQIVDGDFVLKADGNINLVTGRDCLAQDIRIMLLSEIILMEFLKDEYTEINRLDFEQRVVDLLESDPRIIPGTVTCQVHNWERDNVKVMGSFQPADEGNPMNLVIGYDLDDLTVEVLTND